MTTNLREAQQLRNLILENRTIYPRAYYKNKDLQFITSEPIETQYANRVIQPPNVELSEKLYGFLETFKLPKLDIYNPDNLLINGLIPEVLYGQNNMRRLIRLLKDRVVFCGYTALAILDDLPFCSQIDCYGDVDDILKALKLYTIEEETDNFIVISNYKIPSIIVSKSPISKSFSCKGKLVQLPANTGLFEMGKLKELYTFRSFLHTKKHHLNHTGGVTSKEGTTPICPTTNRLLQAANDG